MMDITTIPTDTLEVDLQESKNDISTCEIALLTGITSYSGGSVQERLDDNKRFVKIISEELDRRHTLSDLNKKQEDICPTTST
jgi:hypothetical protein